MGKSSRDKGCRGEREWAEVLRNMGFSDAHRGCQHHGRPDAPDVAGGIPGTHAEVKRVERLNLQAAFEQAERDAGNAIPYVAHRRNRGHWLVTIRAADLADFMVQLNKEVDR